MKSDERVEQGIRDGLAGWVAFRRQLHQHPEIAYQEFETARLVAERLRALPGWEVVTGVAKTGVVAVLGRDRPGPCIALRADMDCLPMEDQSGRPWSSRRPGFAHTCGHDGHTTMLLGAAEVLSHLRDELAGPVKLVFQPAEEGGAGGEAMVAEGVLENPPVAAMFGQHGFGDRAMALGQMGICRGPAMAGGVVFKVIVRGKGGHAAIPHEAVDPIHAAAQIVTSAQSIISRWNLALDPLVVTFGKFHAGTATNIIPDHAVLEGTIRALRPEVLEAAKAEFTRLAMGVAAAHRTVAEVQMLNGYPPVVNDARAHAYATAIAQSVLGEANVMPDYPPVMGSEDFAFYARAVPSTFSFLGLRPADVPEVPGCHHPAFDFNDDALVPGIRYFVELARHFAHRWPAG